MLKVCDFHVPCQTLIGLEALTGAWARAWMGIMVRPTAGGEDAFSGKGQPLTAVLELDRPLGSGARTEEVTLRFLGCSSWYHGCG